MEFLWQTGAVTGVASGSTTVLLGLVPSIVAPTATTHGELAGNKSDRPPQLGWLRKNNQK
jgi:hypothetical protein